MAEQRWKDIFQAAEQKDTSAVEYFIEQARIPVNCTESYEQQTVAHIAARNKDLQTLAYLLKLDPSLLSFDDVYFETVSTVSIAQGALDVIKYLVEEHLLDISQPNEKRFGNTAIHEAAQENKLEILKYFIEEKQGDVNIRNEFGQPPAFVAADRYHIRIVKYLLLQGANLTITDDHNDNILYISARKGDVNLAKFLLDDKRVRLNVNWRNNLNMTIVHTASKFNQLNFLKYIVEQKSADIDILDKSGRSALHFAAQANNYDLIKYLYKQGANPELKDIFGNTPLKLATEKGSISFLKKVTVTRYRRSDVMPVENQENHRSILSSVRSASNCESIRLCLPQPWWSIGNGFPAREFDFCYLGTVAFIMDFCFRYLTRYRHLANEHTTVEDLIESGIDSLALDAV